MVILDAAGLVLAGVTAVLQTYAKVEDHLDAREELRKLLPGFEKRVQYIQKSVISYFHGKSLEGIPELALRRTLEGFEGIKEELDSLLENHGARNRFRRGTRFTQHVEEVRRCSDKLKALEAQVHNLGCHSLSLEVVLNRFDDVLGAIENNPASRNDSEISKVVNSIKNTQFSEYACDIHEIPDKAKELLDVLSKSGIPEDTKLEFSKVVRKVWEDWKVSDDDIVFSGRKRRIGKGGSAQIYAGRMKFAGELMEVAVKEFAIRREHAEERFPSFIREVFLQKHARHPCIVRTFGGYWPDPEELDDDDELEPFIVMERMTYNLKQARDRPFLKSMDSKRRILRDIAEGIAHLHSRRIVHRDIKPGNVLMRVDDDGKIVGRAKICDFGVSRKSYTTSSVDYNIATSTERVGDTSYMAPEAFSESAPEACKTARDIWSFGVLICEVLVRDFFPALVQDYPAILGVTSVSRELTDKIQEKAKRILSGDAMGRIAIRCLSLDPKDRPKIEDVLKSIVDSAPTYQFHFTSYMSREYREKEVVGYVRNRFDADAEVSTSVTIIEEEVGAESTDLCAQNLLAYCYYFGIGVTKDEEKAISLYQGGCEAEDTEALCCLGYIYFSARSFVNAAPLLRKAAEMGCGEAMKVLASCYLYGHGVERNDNEAFKLVTRAVALGNDEAKVRLAAYYRDGIGTGKDENRAISIINELYNRGNGFAAMELALCYKEGLGVSTDREKAEEFLGKARARGIVASWDFNKERN